MVLATMSLQMALTCDSSSVDLVVLLFPLGLAAAVTRLTCWRKRSGERAPLHISWTYSDSSTTPASGIQTDSNIVINISLITKKTKTNAV